jgi:predicted amidohydrolase YtcJ
MQADLLLFNGHIYTMDVAHPRAEAIAIAGNHILALGDGGELRGLLRPGAQVIDLGGRAALPGLIDAHIHFGWYSYGLWQGEVDLDNVPTRAEAVARVAEAARQKPPGQWIRGSGWNRNVWADRAFPTAADLDGVSPDHPVALEDKSHHATWVNTRGLELAGITASTQDPPGGQIVREASGRPAGVLLETATELVHAVIPPPDVEAMTEALQQGTLEAQRLGLTGIHDPGHRTVLAAFQVLWTRGNMGLRALVHVPTEDLDAALQVGLRSGLGDQYLRIGGVKLFADGALGPQTAHMLDPYEGAPDNLGLPTHPPDELRELVQRANSGGLSVAVHAIGDAANRAVMDAVAHAQSQRTGPEVRIPNRIEHLQLLHPDDVPRLSRLGIVASMQPIHATSDMEMAERLWGRRSDMAYAWRSVLDSAAILAFGSDCPVETLDPLAGIHAAVTRRRADGSPGPEGWIPGQRLSVGEAVHAYTVGAARASGEVYLKGSLVPGKLADVVVLSRDIFQIDPMEILDTTVEMTIFDGRIVHNVVS